MSLTLPTSNRAILSALRSARALLHQDRRILFTEDTDWTDQAAQWEEDEPEPAETVRTSRVYTGIVSLTTRNSETTEAVAR